MSNNTTSLSGDENILILATWSSVPLKVTS